MQRADGMFNLPNVLSLSRIGLAIAFVLESGTTVRVALIGAASATDFLDGWIARRRHITSRWGALLDPITDRAFVFAAVSSYVMRDELSTAQYFTLLSRDIMTAIGFLVARGVSWLKPVEFHARMPGKIVTVLQLITLLAVLLVPRAVSALVIAVGVLSVVAVADYTLMLWRNRAR